MERLSRRGEESLMIRRYIAFEATLISWWTMIVVSMLLFLFTLLQCGLTQVGEHRASVART
jgi:hypothetical protein